MIDVPIPKRMRKLPLDNRGYPIPVIVQLDVDGTPLFSVNDFEQMNAKLLDDCCPVCGDKLLRGRWFVGGPLSAFHPQGGFHDGGMHGECKDYALQVCPWLAAPKYTKAISAAKMKGNFPTVTTRRCPVRPDPFVAVLARGQTLIAPETLYDAYVIKPLKPFIRIQFWRHGQLMDFDEGFKQAMIRVGVIPNPQEKSLT